VIASGSAADLAAGSLISEAFLGKAPAAASGAPRPMNTDR
jgi:hypothetical protein